MHTFWVWVTQRILWVHNHSFHCRSYTNQQVLPQIISILFRSITPSALLPLCQSSLSLALSYTHTHTVGVICAAQMPEGAWWRAQVMGHHEDTMVELRYVDYGGYDIVKMDTLRQIR